MDKSFQTESLLNFIETFTKRIRKRKEVTEVVRLLCNNKYYVLRTLNRIIRPIKLMTYLGDGTNVTCRRNFSGKALGKCTLGRQRIWNSVMDMSFKAKRWMNLFVSCPVVDNAINHIES
jgi:hypothetical protein